MLNLFQSELNQIIAKYSAHIERDILTGNIFVTGKSIKNKDVSFSISTLIIDDTPIEILLRNIQLMFEDRIEGILSSKDLNRLYTMKINAHKIIQDIHLPQKQTDSIVIAGGCFTSIYHQTHIKDIDLFALKNDDLHNSINTLIGYLPVDRVVESDINYLNNVNNNSKKIKRVVLDKHKKIQYILTDYNTREELIEHFDLEHSCISFHRNALYMTNSAFECVKNKKLKIHNNNKVEHWRIEKFTKKGFTV